MIPSNSFVENPWKCPWIFPGNPRKFPGIFHRKICWKWQQLFRAISCNPFRRTRSKEFLVTNFKEIVVTNSAEKLEKMSTKFVEFPVKSSSEPIPGNFLGWFSQEFLRNILIYSQHILSKFTNQDLSLIVVNN